MRGGLDGLDNGLYQGFNERLCELLAANMALHETDLLLVFGARLDDRVTGDPSRFAPDARFECQDSLRIRTILGAVCPSHNGGRRGADGTVPVFSSISRALCRSR